MSLEHEEAVARHRNSLVHRRLRGRLRRISSGIAMGLILTIAQKAHALRHTVPMTYHDSPSADVRNAIKQAIPGYADPEPCARQRPGPKMVAAQVSLDGKGMKQIVAVLPCQCGNHACDYNIVKRSEGKWGTLQTIKSWCAIQVLPTRTQGMSDIISFDHTTDDCLLCSPPHALKWTWNGKQYQRNDTALPYSDYRCPKSPWAP